TCDSLFRGHVAPHSGRGGTADLTSTAQKGEDAQDETHSHFLRPGLKNRTAAGSRLKAEGVIVSTLRILSADLAPHSKDLVQTMNHFFCVIDNMIFVNKKLR
ncbi:hypothetical protein KUCAC02_026578, partial [Chaenocephalus aceratus]